MLSQLLANDSFFILLEKLIAHSTLWQRYLEFGLLSAISGCISNFRRPDGLQRAQNTVGVGHLSKNSNFSWRMLGKTTECHFLTKQAFWWKQKYEQRKEAANMIAEESCFFLKLHYVKGPRPLSLIKLVQYSQKIRYFGLYLQTGVPKEQYPFKNRGCGFAQFLILTLIPSSQERCKYIHTL